MNQQARRNAEQAAMTFVRCIERYFGEQAPRADQISVEATGGPRGAFEEGRGVACPLTFTLPDGSHMQGGLRVNNAGGNVYDVAAHVGPEEPASFSITLPEPQARPEGLEATCGTLHGYLLRALERQTGERVLKEATKKRGGGK